MTGDGPANWLGADFWSRTGGTFMWRNYDPQVVDAELDVLARHGLTVTRSFFFWPDFMPSPDEIDETLAARFADFLYRHTEHGLATIPTFIVGHMSGENWDPARLDVGLNDPVRNQDPRRLGPRPGHAVLACHLTGQVRVACQLT
jgi:hypothetical protein